MNPLHLLDEIRASDELLEIFTWPYDLSIVEAADSEEWFIAIEPMPSNLRFRIETGDDFQIFGKDGSGGLFALCGPQGQEQPVFYTNSEGQAGIVAYNLYEFMQIIAPLPYWRDLLHFSGSGQLLKMREAIPHCEQEIQEDEPQIDHFRNLIFEKLRLSRLADPVINLHHAVQIHSNRYRIVNSDGDRFDTLFNSFVATDNPMWRESG